MAIWTLTANRLSDGSVVYLRADRIWSGVLNEAWTAGSSDDGQLQLEWARTQESDVCDPYLLEVDRGADGLLPRSARERIRAEGPGPTLRRLGYAEALEQRRRAG